MNDTKLTRTIALSFALLFVTASSALAGPPLVCWKVETGGAASLPWIDRARTYEGTDESYAISNLTRDTLALLTKDAPVLARMETLRRASLYAVKNGDAQTSLLKQIVARTEAHPDDALAWFDAGYLVETLRQAQGKNEPIFWTQLLEKLGMRKSTADGLGKATGYDCVTKAITLSGKNPEMEYAAALITWYPRRTEHETHLANAARGATEGSLLEKNLLERFGDRGATLAALRASVSAASR